jgi:phage tail-like protein
MARPSSKDPLDKFRWSVEIDGFDRLGFASCETPSVALNTNKYAEGGNHLFPKNIVDSVEYRPVTLQRGVTSDLNFDKWITSYFDFIRGKVEQVKQNLVAPSIYNPDPLYLPERFPTPEYRKTVIIKHLDRAGRAVKIYTLYQAFPIEYKPASDFSSDTDDTLSMEKLVLCYESFSVESITPDTNPLNPSDVLKRLIRRF